jgi:hypothetical protein
MNRILTSEQVKEAIKKRAYAIDPDIHPVGELLVNDWVDESSRAIESIAIAQDAQTAKAIVDYLKCKESHIKLAARYVYVDVALMKSVIKELEEWLEGMK